MAKSKSAGLWPAFYDSATRFRDLAPWRWVYDSDIFGVQHPETGVIGWCCIMGAAGQHYALAVYRGAEGLDSYYQLAEANEFENPDNPEAFNAILSQNCWMVSFEDAGMVPSEQKAHLRALGLSFRGAGQWILAQTYDPGMQPWLVDENDLPYLIHCLEQAMDVAQRYKQDDQLLDGPGGHFLIRTAQMHQNTLVWEDQYLSAEDFPAAVEPTPVEPSKAFLEAVKFQPVLDGAVVIASFFSPQAIQENKNKRPWHPMLLVCIEPGSGYILAQEIAACAEVPEALEKFLLQIFKATGGKPRQIGVHYEPMLYWLEKIGEEADIEIVELMGDEPFLTDVVQTLSGFF